MNSIACECIQSYSVEKSFNDSELVIHAKILSKEYVNYIQTLNPQWADTINRRIKEKGQLIDLNSMASNVVKVKIQVIKSFKNKTHLDTLIIFTPRNASNCGFTKFEIGKEFLIFNGTDFLKNNYLKEFENQNTQLKNSYWTNKCTGTTEFNLSLLDSLNLITAPIRVIQPKNMKCEFYLDSLTNERIYFNSTKHPEFPNGQEGLLDFYKTNTNFTPLKNVYSDTTYISQVAIIINPNGRISRLHFINSAIPSYENAILSLIKKMPLWSVGICENHQISYEVILNFRFESKQDF